MLRVGIDIGGTFTDLCVVEDATGVCRSGKILTTSDDPSRAFLHILRSAVEADQFGQIRELVHATTVATNAILEGKTARIGMITTAGFRDVLEIGRHFRRDIYNLLLEKPPVLVPRQWRLEVPERMAADGSVILPLDEEAVRSCTRRLVSDGAQVVLVCFLNSYANASHERRAAELIAETTDVPVIASHAVCSEYREYERFSTAAVNAAVMPTVSRYVRNIERGLHGASIEAPLSIMQSSGGMADSELIVRQPAQIVESGPAAGVISAVEVGRRLGLSDLISFDMGGTTAKATLVRGGRIVTSKDYEVGGGIQGGFGTGYPLRVPVVDLVEIGTGGGSIAHLDDVRQLHVGPHSAGAMPGPACYGRGGTAPTVTDADLVLGRLRADRFAGGQIALDVDAARSAIESKVARPLGMDLFRAAEGIVAIANAQMVRALQLVSVERGLDPRDFAIVAFGGAGPMHGAELAMELDSPRVIVPTEAGVQSAWGLLVADARRDFAQSVVSKDAPLRPLYDAMVAQGREELTRAGFAANAIEARLAIDVRYLGQAYELTVELPEAPDFSDSMRQRVNDLFHVEHQRLYGHGDPAARVQWVTLRARVIGRVPRPCTRSLEVARSPLSDRRFGSQAMTWAGKTVDAPVYLRESLRAGDNFVGPALVVQDDASLALPPGVRLSVEPTADIVLETGGAR